MERKNTNFIFFGLSLFVVGKQQRTERVWYTQKHEYNNQPCLTGSCGSWTLLQTDLLSFRNCCPEPGVLCFYFIPTYCNFAFE